MTYDEIVETLRTYAAETLGDCPKDCPIKQRQGATFRAVLSEAASALEDLVELARNNEDRECEAEERIESLRRMLVRKQTKLNILHSELRRMFQLYVAAEARADTGVNTEELDDL